MPKRITPRQTGKSVWFINCGIVHFPREASDTVFAPRMKAVLRRAFAIHKCRDTLAASTLYQYRYDLQRHVDRCLASQPTKAHGRRLQKRYAKIQDHLCQRRPETALQRSG